MNKEEMKNEVKRIAEEKRINLSDEMLEQVAGGYYSNWDQLDRNTQLKLQQESVLNMARGKYCEVFNNKTSTEYQG